jgi:DNA-binding MarR family transcriptional regulator
MQQRGLIERSNCNEDRRGAFVVLTEQGRVTVEAAAPRHVESVRRYMFDLLTVEQVESLGAISTAVVQLLDTVCAGRDEAEDSDCG